MRSLENTLAVNPAALGGGLWTPSFLAFVLPLRAEQVLKPADLGQGVTPASRSEWVWIQTAQRLAWCYGEDEAVRRLNSYGA